PQAGARKVPQAAPSVAVLGRDRKAVGQARRGRHGRDQGRLGQAAGTRCVQPEVADQRALALREALPARRHTNALRLVHGESDGLPGLIVDRYADVLVAQFLAAGVERWRDPILDALAELTGCEAIYERSDAETRKLEGLSARAGFVRGNRNASRCPITEYGLNFKVDVEQGQKTGFFLDQRENRQQVRALAAGREVLDGFCYT